MSTAHQNENAERITRSIDSNLMMLAALTLIVAALDEHAGCTDPFFITQPTACLCISAVRRRAIAPQDNACVNRGVETFSVSENGVGYNGRLRPSDDWPTLAVRTLRFNALLSRDIA